MNVATSRSQRAGRLVSLATIGAMLAVLLPAGQVAFVLAANSVTPASGTAISADTTTAAGGSGAWTTLTGPQLNGTGGTLVAGTQTFTIADPSAFEFRAGVGSASRTGSGCDTLAISGTPTVLAASVSVTLTGGPSIGDCNITLSGLQVRPKLAGAAPLESSAIDAGGIVVGAGLGGTLTTVPGAALLSFTNAPIANAAAGVNLVPQPVVHSQDVFSNARAGDSIALTIKAGTGAVGGALDCTTTVLTDAGGNANFADCDIDEAGTGYVLRATTGSSSAESNAFNITAGAATKLAFQTQPSRGTPNGAFAAQPVVEIQDALGNRVNDTTTVVTLALQTGTGTLSCTGGLTKTAGTGGSGTPGLASFTGCAVSTAGIGKVIRATAPGLTQIDSSAFDVVDQVVFTTQPSTTATAGTVFAAQPVVAVRAGSTTAVNDDVSVVTLSLKTGTGATGATLSCTGGLSKTVVDGVATFAGCMIDKISPASPANPYRILASTTGLTNAESGTVAITPGVASRLTFVTQPAGAAAGTAFTTQPIVAITDAGGNIVTSGVSANVSLTIGTNPGVPAGVLSCVPSITVATATSGANAGKAVFSGCKITNSGVGYTLNAIATNVVGVASLTAATSTPFTVTAPGAQITVTPSASTITWGQYVTVTTAFAVNGAGKTFTLQGSRDGLTWSTLATLTAGAGGTASFLYKPATNLYYKAVFAGTSDLLPGTSNTARTVVRQIALLRPTNGGLVKSIARNTSITFTTTVRPARADLPAAKVTFRFYRLSGGSWTLVTTRDVIIDVFGKAATTFRFTSGGSWYVRSIANPTSYNANSVWSPVERYNVR
jgi:hypothetical protein